MRCRLCVAVLCSLASLGALAAPKLLQDIPLQWKPTTELGAAVQTSHQKIRFVAFKDVRDNPKLIAENREKATPKPVTTKDDVGAFVTDSLRRIFDREGFSTVDASGDLVISGEVRRFFVEETDTYKGDVLLHVTVTSHDGKTLWDGNTSGAASTFGRSYKAENYYEVLSNSLIDATTTLLKNHDFVQALGT
jgi:hypothetical protein